MGTVFHADVQYSPMTSDVGGHNLGASKDDRHRENGELLDAAF